MGAWDIDIFGNDTACDWAFGLEEVDDLSLIESSIQKALDAGTEYLEAPDAEEALAAAETLARLKGRFGARNAYTEPVDKWVSEHKIVPPQGLVDSALKVIDRILTPPSEILELWEEGEDFQKWKDHLDDLKKRLQ